MTSVLAKRSKKNVQVGHSFWTSRTQTTPLRRPYSWLQRIHEANLPLYTGVNNRGWKKTEGGTQAERPVTVLHSYKQPATTLSKAFLTALGQGRTASSRSPMGYDWKFHKLIHMGAPHSLIYLLTVHAYTDKPAVMFEMVQQASFLIDFFGDERSFNSAGTASHKITTSVCRSSPGKRRRKIKTE